MIDRKKYLERAKVAVKAAVSARDLAMSNSVATISELDKCINVLYEKLTEWYGLYFPELRSQEAKTYCNVVLNLDRDNPDEGKIAGVVGQSAASKIVSLAKNSMGASFPESDLESPKSLARQILSLISLREELETYQNYLAMEICPNVSHLTEPSLAAKLVAQARGVQRLALMPASTIQVMGASKALFKHLKSGSKPPKHGVIFQHASISMSPKKERGRVARALSAKIAIAARADAFSKNFIAPKLKEGFEKRLKGIKGQ